jgi:hypothetical protein
LTKTKKRTLICVNGVLLALMSLCIWQCRAFETTLTSQQAAKYWRGESEERFAQVSCFFPTDASVTTDTVNSFRKTIDKKLGEAGVEMKDAGRSWTDAYAIVGSLNVSSERASAETTAIAVGGNFFGFHPYRLLSGNYLNETDLMQDRIVIDHELAWKLFGGTQLAGQSVTINGKPFYVAGVIERENDRFSQRALSGADPNTDSRTSGTPPLLFLSYSAYASLSGGGDVYSDSGSVRESSAAPGLSCYEIVLPDPISKFGVNFVAESFREQRPITVENSARYRFSNIWSFLKTPGARSVITSPVVYPYWENAARVSEDYVARAYVLIALLAVFPLLCLVWLIVRLVRFLSAKVKVLCFNVWDAWDDRYGRRQAREQRKAMRKAVIEAVESGELPPEELPAPETAAEKFEALFGKTKRTAERVGEKSKRLFRRTPKRQLRAKGPRRPAKKVKLLGAGKRTRRRSAGTQTAERAASLLSEFEQMDLERIVQEVLDEEAAANGKDKK